MTNKQQDQAYALMMKLPDVPRSIDKAGRYFDAFLINFNFEQMPKKEHDEVITAMQNMLTKYRKIRGR